MKKTTLLLITILLLSCSKEVTTEDPCTRDVIDVENVTKWETVNGSLEEVLYWRIEWKEGNQFGWFDLTTPEWEEFKGNTNDEYCF